MEYQEIVKQVKNKISNLTTVQRTVAVCFLLILIAGGIFLLNPKKKLIEMRNSQRRNDVVNIVNAVYEYSRKNQLPDSITSAPTMICKSEASSCEGLVDLSKILATEEKFLSEVPADPSIDDSNSSGYQIYRSSNGRINVTAPLAENKAVISLSK